MRRKGLKLEDVPDYLRYEPDTGLLFWKRDPGTHKLTGKPSGTLQPRGYIHVRFGRKMYPAHRIAWYLTHGKMPDGYIDHVNGDPSDNRLSNLREATPLENARNRRAQSSPWPKGVGILSSGRFQARIRVNYRHLYLGSYPTAEEAHAAYCAAAIKHHGEFARFE